MRSVSVNKRSYPSRSTARAGRRALMCMSLAYASVPCRSLCDERPASSSSRSQRSSLPTTHGTLDDLAASQAMASVPMINACWEMLRRSSEQRILCQKGAKPAFVIARMTVRCASARSFTSAEKQSTSAQCGVLCVLGANTCAPPSRPTSKRTGAGILTTSQNFGLAPRSSRRAHAHAPRGRVRACRARAARARGWEKSRQRRGAPGRVGYY